MRPAVLHATGLWLWGAGLALALLLVLPLASGWRIGAGVLWVGLLVLIWRRWRGSAQRRKAEAHPLPPAGFQYPVMLVCGDGLDTLFADAPTGSLAVRVSAQGCYVRVPGPLQLVEITRQVLALRPQWRGQLCSMLTLAPQLHADSAVLAGQLRGFAGQLKRARREGLRLPLLLVSYLHDGQAQGNWFSWQGAAQVWQAGTSTSLGEWQQQARSTEAGTARLHACVRANGLARWLAEQTLPLRPQAFALLCGAAPQGQPSDNLWQRWLGETVALRGALPVEGQYSAQQLWPDALLQLMPTRPGNPHRHAIVAGAWLFALVASLGLLSVAWQNTLLARQVSDDLRRYAIIAPGTDFQARRDAALAELRQTAARLDSFYRQGEPWPLGLGLYQGERLRPAVQAAIASHPRPAPTSTAASPTTLRLDSLALFASGSAQLKPQATPALVRALAGIQARPGWLIVIAGHTDATGSEAHNLRLSRARATAVHDWLQRMGEIPDNCLAVQGFGASQPLASNATEQGRSANRRVEIRLVPEPGACLPPAAAPGQTRPQAAALNL